MSTDYSRYEVRRGTEDMATGRPTAAMLPFDLSGVQLPHSFK
ncbi:hypothetical protein [Streptomyces aquilus]